MNEPAGGYWLIALSLLAAAVLALVPLERSLSWWRPEWALLVLVYWTIALPHRVGMATAMLIGLLTDVSEGAPLGQNMLALTLVVTLARLMYRRLRVFTLAQQAAVIFVFAGLHQLITHWLHSAQGIGAAGLTFLLPAFTTALLWPCAAPALRGLRRRYRVN